MTKEELYELLRENLTLKVNKCYANNYESDIEIHFNGKLITWAYMNIPECRCTHD